MTEIAVNAIEKPTPRLIWFCYFFYYFCLRYKMSLNNATNYPVNGPKSNLDVRVHNQFVSSDVNLVMDGAQPGDVLVLDEFGDITWQPVGGSAGESLEHFQSYFDPRGPISSINYTDLPMTTASIPDPLGNITIENNAIRIAWPLQTVFIMIVKFAVDVQSYNSSYEFTMERKDSASINTGEWVFYLDFGRVSSNLLKEGSEFGEQTLTCQFSIDSIGPANTNTYYKFLCKKLDTISADANFLDEFTNVTVIRVV